MSAKEKKKKKKEENYTHQKGETHHSFPTSTTFTLYSMPSPPLPLLLQKEDTITLTVYDEATNTLTTQSLLPQFQTTALANPTSVIPAAAAKSEDGVTAGIPSEANEDPFHGDYTECTIHFNPAHPASFAHATTSTLYYSKVVRRRPASPPALSALFGIQKIFQCTMPQIIRQMQFSPLGTYLVAYAWMDSKRLGEGNLYIFHTLTGTLCRRVVQGAWPALSWTADESYVVRYTQGELQVLEGNRLHLSDNPSTGTPNSTTAVKMCMGPVSPGGLGKVLSSMPIRIAKEKEIEFSCSPFHGFPFVGVFIPFEEGHPASFSVFRLPQMKEEKDAFVQFSFGRAEAATVMWSPSGKYAALLVKQSTSSAAEKLTTTAIDQKKSENRGWGSAFQPTALEPKGGNGGLTGSNGSSTNSYYGKLTLCIVDVTKRALIDVKLKSVLGGGSSTAAAAANLDVVHDCCWRPKQKRGGPGSEVDKLLVIHANMPRNRATLVRASDGMPVLTFGEGPRNTIRWSPDGGDLLVGGSGNLAGDYQIYSDYPTTDTMGAGSANTFSLTHPAAKTTERSKEACVGEINEKCSVEKWAPDSYHVLFATIFTRLRVDNKIVIAKKNGVKRLTEKFKTLYGAYWIDPAVTEAHETSPKGNRATLPLGDASKDVPSYPLYRAASPRPLEAVIPKPQVYRPPGAASAARTLTTAGSSRTGSTVVNPVGIVGGQVAAPKKRRKR